MIKEAGNITIPVLVLQAGADTAVTPQGQNRFCEKLKQDTGRPCYGGQPIRLEGAKHELLIESDDYRIPAITQILDFFSAVE
jgi:lysophospholipase